MSRVVCKFVDDADGFVGQAATTVIVDEALKCRKTLKEDIETFGADAAVFHLDMCQRRSLT